MIGVDEVGRGCLAGPLLVVAARSYSELPVGLKDSKLLSRSQREVMLELLVKSCRFGEGWVSPADIDKNGLAQALRLGLKRALRAVEAGFDEDVIYDGPINYAPKFFTNVTCMIDADELVPLVSAASIYAKVKRDVLMTKLKKEFPDYGFESHVGYATKKHREAIDKYGPIKSVHRLSFAPFRQLEMGI